ncbi:DUF4190 domain-containing protein [Arthrobacter sp. AQ5-05]|uniref:DUF4190 domain-containing protein n=1 Tax=Arthrobacter sp. AQ5-05 TaxID=2184581 RepID=UPI001C65DA1E|nr:DUF4190 domain-containing protein [Arthrobacter sp. AQ5-05]
MLLVVAAAIVVVVLVVKAATKPNQRVNTAVGPGGQQLPPTQVGYALDGQPLYQQPAQPGTNIFAILALVLGLFTGILGIVFGHIARSQIKQTGQAGDGLALAGLIIGYIWLGFFVLGIMGAFALR